jgi:hypothetical protein
MAVSKEGSPRLYVASILPQSLLSIIVAGHS